MKIETTHMQDLHDQAGRDGKPEYVLSTDGVMFENPDFAKREASARKRLLTHGKHEPEITWDKELDGGYNDKDPRARVLVKCKCGNQSIYGRAARVNKNGAIPSTYVTSFNAHILAVQAEEEGKRLEMVGVAEPSLVARVHLVRTTHEWWVYHVNSDLAKEITKGSYSYRGYNWKLAVKKSNGWTGKGSVNSREEAVAAVLQLVEKEKYRGHTVQIFDTSTTVGVEAPVATIITSVRRLIDDAKKLKDNASPHEIAAVLQVTDDGLTQLEMLLDLKKDLTTRFNEALDL